MKIDLKVLKENFEKNVKESHTMRLPQANVAGKYSQEIMNVTVPEFLEVVKTMDMGMSVEIEKLLDRMSAETR